MVKSSACQTGDSTELRERRSASNRSLLCLGHVRILRGMQNLSIVAPAFVEMAHRIVWAVAATVDAAGQPRTRVLHPIWDFTDDQLTGWICTSPQSPKAADLGVMPALSLTYWIRTQDTCTADCDVVWDDTPKLRQAGWERFLNGPAPVGYDPTVVPGWTDPQNPAFGVIRLTPHRLRVMAGTVMTAGQGEVLTWAAPA